MKIVCVDLESVDRLHPIYSILLPAPLLLKIVKILYKFGTIMCFLGKSEFLLDSLLPYFPYLRNRPIVLSFRECLAANNSAKLSSPGFKFANRS